MFLINGRLVKPCKETLGIPETKLNDPTFSLLQHLGFSPNEIEEANTYACGTMTIEGAHCCLKTTMQSLIVQILAVKQVKDFYQLKVIYI